MEKLLKDVRANVPIKFNGKWNKVDSEFALPEELANSLVRQGHASFSAGGLLPEQETGGPQLFEGLSKPEIIEELMQVEIIDDKFALGLFELGIYGVEALSKKSVKEISKVSGIGKKTAEAILESIEADFSFETEDSEPNTEA